ncbi:hypothetical protein KBI33_01230 [Candidatus Shapirobacteria bacterium]|nr:hypothetical protein [Candidatus Shapirobacteria bacterium]
MSTTVLQVPLPKDLKSSASAVAKEYGFSSLQEVVRIFLTKLSKRELAVEIGPAPIYLSKKAGERYQKMDEDFKAGKNIFQAVDADDLMDQLAK